MAAGDWYEYHENSVDDDGRTSSDSSAYQIHQEDDIKEYELPPSATNNTSNNNTGTNTNITDTLTATSSTKTTNASTNGGDTTAIINGYHDVKSNGISHHTKYDAFSSSSPSTSKQGYTGSFFARLAAIPLVQGSISNANNIVQQHAFGRFAGRTLSTLVTKTQPYIPTSVVEKNSRLYAHLERANALGNMSLDLVEQRFPMLVHATGQDLKHAPNFMANDIRNRIDTAIHRFRAPADAASHDMSRRMSLVIDNVEAVLDQYFPQEEGAQNEKKQEQDMEDELIDPQDGQRLNVDDEGEEIQNDDVYSHSQLIRMYRIANSLSIRIAKRIAVQLDTTGGGKKKGEDEKNSNSGEQQEEQAAAMMRLGGWLFTQTQQLVDHLNTYKSQLPEPIQAHVVQPIIDIAQKEYDILRQELDRKDASHVERARNMLTMSQDMVLMPLLQRSVESMRSHVVSYRSMAQQNRAQVMNELSTKVPFLANIAPMSAFASHHFSMNKKSEHQTEGKKLNGVHISPNTEDNIINSSSTTTAAAAEAC